MSCYMIMTGLTLQKSCSWKEAHNKLTRCIKFKIFSRLTQYQIWSPYIYYRSSGEKLLKYQENLTWLIVCSTLLTFLTNKSLILQWEIWLRSLLGLKGLICSLGRFLSRTARLKVTEAFRSEMGNTREERILGDTTQLSSVTNGKMGLLQLIRK